MILIQLAFTKYNNSILGNDHKEYYLLEWWFFLYLSQLFLILGEGYRLGDGSMTNPKDTCYKCPSGTYNRGIIDTAKMAEFDYLLDVCAPIDCSCHGRLCPSITLLYQIIFLYLFVIFICIQFAITIKFIDMSFISIKHANDMPMCWVFMFNIYFCESINNLIYNIYYSFHFDKYMNFRWNRYWKWRHLWERWRKNMRMRQGTPVLRTASFCMSNDGRSEFNL